jgi:prepilin-type N-terminal cleavage/methylation domain-containing protein
MKLQRNQTHGFTLVEIMIVVAIIALLAAIAVPNFLRARKRSQGTHILEDLRLLDEACDQYAIETNKISGMHPTFGDLKNYIKTGSVLYTTGTDLFGNTYGPFTIDSVPAVNAAQFNALSDVCPVGFWSPYAVAPY